MVSLNCNGKKVAKAKVWFSFFILLIIYFQSVEAQSVSNNYTKLDSLLKSKKYVFAFELMKAKMKTPFSSTDSTRIKALFKQIDLFRKYYRFSEEELLLQKLRPLLKHDSDIKNVLFSLTTNQLNQLKYVECINYLDSISNLFSFKNDIHTQTKVIGFKST